MRSIFVYQECFVKSFLVYKTPKYFHLQQEKDLIQSKRPSRLGFGDAPFALMTMMRVWLLAIFVVLYAVPWLTLELPIVTKQVLQLLKNKLVYSWGFDLVLYFVWTKLLSVTLFLSGVTWCLGEDKDAWLGWYDTYSSFVILFWYVKNGFGMSWSIKFLHSFSFITKNSELMCEEQWVNVWNYIKSGDILFPSFTTQKNMVRSKAYLKFKIFYDL